jgi:pyruvate dehydrogenase E2 component (dihydrolipoamide acetyltransferase)
MAEKVMMPRLEAAQQTGKLIEWLKAEGEPVKKGEPLFVIETDKVTVEIESPASGVLSGIRAHPGDEIPTSTIIAYLLEPGEDLLKVETEVVPLLEPDSEGQVSVSPEARRLAEARNVDLRKVVGTGPKGQVTKEDVEQAASEPMVPQFKVDRIIPLEGMRRTVANRMMMSYQTVPHIAFTVRVDMGNVEEAREKIKLGARKQGPSHVTITSFLVKAASLALEKNPLINSTLKGEDIHVLSDINIGVATALDEGLIVPVVHHADQKDLLEIASEMNDLVTRAHKSQLTLRDVSGATFTVSNLGPFGIEHFSAIINPPQTAVLAVGVIQSEVVPDEGGELLVRPVMRMTLSADHRVVDGALAARFLADVREALESFHFFP